MKHTITLTAVMRLKRWLAKFVVLLTLSFKQNDTLTTLISLPDRYHAYYSINESKVAIGGVVATSGASALNVKKNSQ